VGAASKNFHILVYIGLGNVYFESRNAAFFSGHVGRTRVEKKKKEGFFGRHLQWSRLNKNFRIGLRGAPEHGRLMSLNQNEPFKALRNSVAFGKCHGDYLRQ
jgi:hypothetical protein